MKKTIKNNIKLLMYIATLIMLLLSACTSQSETDNKESVKTEAKKSKKKSSNKKKSSKKKKKNKKDKNKEKGKIYRTDLLGEVIICLE